MSVPDKYLFSFYSSIIVLLMLLGVLWP